MIFRLIFFVDDIRENASDIGIKQHNIFRILKRNIMEDIDSIVNKYELLLFIIMMMMMIEEREKKKIKEFKKDLLTTDHRGGTDCTCTCTGTKRVSQRSEYQTIIVSYHTYQYLLHITKQRK